MARTRGGWARRLGLALLLVVLAVTLASLTYNTVTGGAGKPATALSPGPFVRVDGTLVAYRRWGETGSPIVLVGGFVEPSWVWAKVGRLLGRRHRVYAVDLPPFGYTERRAVHACLVDRARAPLRAAARDRAAARRRPLPRRRGGCRRGARTPGAGGGDRAARRGRALCRAGCPLALPPRRQSVLHHRLPRGPDSDRIFRSGLRDAYGPRRPPLDDALLDAWQRPFRVDGTAAAFRQMLGYGIQGYEARELRRVTVPRLVVWGSRDTVDSVSSGRQAAADLRARLVLLPRAGHLSMLVDPRGVSRAVEGAAG